MTHLPSTKELLNELDTWTTIFALQKKLFPENYESVKHALFGKLQKKNLMEVRLNLTQEILSNRRVKIESLQQAVVELCTAKDHLATAYNEKGTQYHKIKGRHDYLTQEISKAKRDLEQLKAENRGLDSAVNERRASVVALTTVLERDEKIEKDLDEEINKLCETVSNLESKSATLKFALELIAEPNTGIKAIHGSYNSALNDFQDIDARLKNEEISKPQETQQSKESLYALLNTKKKIEEEVELSFQLHGDFYVKLVREEIAAERVKICRSCD